VAAKVGNWKNTDETSQNHSVGVQEGAKRTGWSNVIIARDGRRQKSQEGKLGPIDHIGRKKGRKVLEENETKKGAGFVKGLEAVGNVKSGIAGTKGVVCVLWM